MDFQNNKRKINFIRKVEAFYLDDAREKNRVRKPVTITLVQPKDMPMIFSDISDQYFLEQIPFGYHDVAKSHPVGAILHNPV